MEKEPPRIDASLVMEEIRSRVAQRKAAGEYTDEELNAIAAMELHLQEREGYGEETDRIISWLHANWEATGEVDPEGQPASTPLKGIAKKISRAILFPVSRLLLGKQNQINARLVQLLSGSIPTLRDGLGDVESRTEQRLAALEREVRKLAEDAGRSEERQSR